MILQWGNLQCSSRPTVGPHAVPPRWLQRLFFQCL